MRAKPAASIVTAVRITALLAAVLLSACVSTGGQPAMDHREAARANTELGAGYIRRGLDEAARDKLERALEQDPRYAPAHATYALLMARMGEDASADSHFRDALKLAPEDPDIRNNYGAFLCARGRVDAAVEQFQRAAEVPGYVGRVTALNNAGLCLRDRAPQQAETFLRRALSLNAQNPTTLEQLAWVRYRQGEYLSARAFLERYQRVEDASAEALWLAAQVEEALGASDAAARYRQQLAAQYPDFDPRRLEAVRAQPNDSRP